VHFVHLFDSRSEFAGGLSPTPCVAPLGLTRELNLQLEKKF